MDFNVHKISGKEYLATKRVQLGDKVYQELKSADIMRPETVYLDEAGKVVEDWATYYALSVKYAMCVLSLHGHLILDDTLTLEEDEFAIENGKLVIFNDEKRAIFEKYTSKRGAE
jgi:hypothetical protein